MYNKYSLKKWIWKSIIEVVYHSTTFLQQEIVSFLSVHTEKPVPKIPPPNKSTSKRSSTDEEKKPEKGRKGYE